MYFNQTTFKENNHVKEKPNTGTQVGDSHGEHCN